MGSEAEQAEPVVDAAVAESTEPVPKKQKTEEQPDGEEEQNMVEGEEDADREQGAEGQNAEEDVAEQSEQPAATVPQVGPIQVGYKTFTTVEEALKYYHYLITHVTLDQDLNEYEYFNVLEVLKKGHPDPQKKIGSGVKAIQVKKYPEMESTCFFIMRTDGTKEDFSVRKCISNLFGVDLTQNNKKPGSFGKGRGRGGRGGGGRGGRFGGRRGGGRGGRGRR